MYILCFSVTLQVTFNILEQTTLTLIEYCFSRFLSPATEQLCETHRTTKKAVHVQLLRILHLFLMQFKEALAYPHRGETLPVQGVPKALQAKI